MCFAMKLRTVATILFLAPILLVSSARAQEEMDLRELYNLCSRFPYNSRCEGLDIPIPLDERAGDEASCSLAVNHTYQTGKCKVAVTDGTLTLYFEEGEPIELLDDRRRSTEFKLASAQIFALNHQLWNEVSGGFFSFSVANQDFATVDIGYLAEPNPDVDNRSYILSILTTTEVGAAIKDQLAPSTTVFNDIFSQGEITFSPASETVQADVSAQVQQLLETKKCIRCDLRGADLESADLDGVNLEGANLQGANLAGAELNSAYLVGANFDGANLAEADLEDARLILASLANANLEAAKLQGVNLQGANLQGANLTGAELIAPIAMQQANLMNAILTDARLEGANLQGANLEGANLEEADLSDITIERPTTFGGVNAGDFFAGFFLGTDSVKNFSFDTNLDGANLRNANLSGTDLEDALLTNADLSGANLAETDLTEANLCGATLPDGSQSQAGC